MKIDIFQGNHTYMYSIDAEKFSYCFAHKKMCQAGNSWQIWSNNHRSLLKNIKTKEPPFTIIFASKNPDQTKFLNINSKWGEEKSHSQF